MRGAEGGNWLDELLLPRLVLRLWIGAVAIEKKRDNLFKNFFPDIDCPMHSIARLNPIDFADGDPPLHRSRAIAKFDVEQIAAQNYRHTMIRVVMPRSGFSRREPLPLYEVISTMMQHLLIWDGGHGRVRW